MPLPKLTRRLFARAVWRSVKDDALKIIADLVAEGMTPDEARDYALEEIRDLLPYLRGPIHRALTRLAVRIDDAVEWQWVKSEKLRDWLEAYDDIGPLLRASADLAIRILSRDQEGGGTAAPLR
jgi:hypothetical protein